MTITYTDKVFKALVDLPLPGQLIIAKKVKPENRETFIETVKMFLDCGFDRLYGFAMDFNNDYTQVRKRRL